LGGLLDDEDAGVLHALGQADRLLGQLDKVDPGVMPWRELLDTAYNNLSELARLAAEYAESVQEDPARLAEIERRRDVLFRLRQKHGATIEAILDTRRQAAAELELLDTAETDLRAIAARRTALDATLKSAAGALSTKRNDASGPALPRGQPNAARARVARGGSSLSNCRRFQRFRRRGRNPSSSWYGSTRAWSGVRLRAPHRAESCPASCSH
jgi:ATPase involved in DNA repair